ncbi:hypothetical protein F4553_001658 [Allocatelliglobosispora scoriae]|uniref:LamG-like jellyroll fold domain-containing protein n=1 Tax=Allocatelliglobosispora scoriae TaxID=643052 RepID=A0A841BM57_9ACTN|nr:LamG domain-containing protein [Allocatelliglobosispora scoriae]MBB5868279.1 hypothetical protein [Allocatelliglobosispora scoriae]
MLPLALVLAAGPLQVLPSPIAPAAPQVRAVSQSGTNCSTTAETELVAKRVAAACDHRVEVTAQRTETTLVYANPNGTMTAEAALKPQRVRRPDGSWVPTDATLTRASDGAVIPVASFLPIRFSGGGTGPLARISKGDKELSITWSGGPLPAPRLDGASAIYPNVFPDVDLRVTADVDAFSEILVVKTRKAAANPAVRRVRFATATKGITLATDPRTGALVAKAGSNVVFSGATPMMWDSTAAVATVAESRTANRPPEQVTSSAEGGAAADRHGLPDRRSAMRTELAAGRLTVLADTALLDDPATVYPVMIDPSVAGGAFHWAMLWKEYGNTSYYDVGCVNCNSQEEQSGLIRVGYQNFSGVSTIRSFFEMDTRSIVGKQVLAARFSMTQSWSGSYCGGPSYPTLLYATDPLYSGITWNSAWNMNYYGAMGANSETRFYNSGSCPQGRVEWNAWDSAAYAASTGLGSMTMALVAEQEWDRNSWRRYQLDPFLSVDYNSYPGTPDDLRTASTAQETGAACVTGSGRPYVRSLTPVLKAHVTDPDSDVLRATATLRVWNPATGAFVADSTIEASNAPANSVAQFTTRTLTNGSTYSWHVQTNDTHADSPATAECEFTVDTTRPAAPQTISSTAYPADGSFHGGVGRTGSFTITPGTGDSADLAAYVWALTPLTTPPTDGTRTISPLAADHSATLLLTPTIGGLNTLRVWSVDKAGNITTTAAPKEYQFLVGDPTEPDGSWTGGDAAGAAQLADDAGSHPAAATGVVFGVPGRLLEGPTAARFNGTSSQAVTTGPVIDTSGSFSIAAWVRPTAAGGNRGVVSIDGLHTSVIRLGSTGTTWWVKGANADVASPLLSGPTNGTVRLNTWTHLAATYDASTAMLTLYVNGEAGGSTSWYPPAAATGSLAVGRAKTADAAAEYFAGDLAEVRVWDRKLQAAEVGASVATLVGSWSLDGNGSDDLGLHDTSAGPGVTWGPDRFGTPGSAVVLSNAAGSYLTASGPVIRTDQSFTVSFWAYLPSPQNAPAAFSVAGNRFSAFELFTTSSGRWYFTRYAADQDNPTSSSMWATGPIGQWTHVVAVYNATAAKSSLYINGVRTSATSTLAGWASSLPLMIGTSTVNGSRLGNFPGSIDDVQVYQGAMPPSQAAAL